MVDIPRNADTIRIRNSPDRALSLPLLWPVSCQEPRKSEQFAVRKAGELRQTLCRPDALSPKYGLFLLIERCVLKILRRFHPDHFSRLPSDSPKNRSPQPRVCAEHADNESDSLRALVKLLCPQGWPLGKFPTASMEIPPEV